MNFLSRLFGGKAPQTRTTTVSNPFCIENPVIGFLNLLGERGTPQMEADRQTLAPLFKSSLVSSDVTPKCQVIFIYCAIGVDGNVEGSGSSVRQLIKEAGAYIAVVASENDPNAYMNALNGPKDWSANIALVMDRKDDKFARFFSELFKDMFNGTSMLMAWVKLAPQIPGREQPDSPETIMAAEAGHLTFKQLD